MADRFPSLNFSLFLPEDRAYVCWTLV